MSHHRWHHQALTPLFTYIMQALYSVMTNPQSLVITQKQTHTSVQLKQLASKLTGYPTLMGSMCTVVSCNAGGNRKGSLPFSDQRHLLQSYLYCSLSARDIKHRMLLKIICYLAAKSRPLLHVLLQACASQSISCQIQTLTSRAVCSSVPCSVHELE